MEYETFKQQLIDNVKYMAGWSKVPGRCVIESAQISGIETTGTCGQNRYQYAEPFQD